MHTRLAIIRHDHVLGRLDLDLAIAVSAKAKVVAALYGLSQQLLQLC
jgi:hypothetical protein